MEVASLSAESAMQALPALAQQLQEDLLTKTPEDFPDYGTYIRWHALTQHRWMDAQKAVQRTANDLVRAAQIPVVAEYADFSYWFPADALKRYAEQVSQYDSPVWRAGQRVVIAGKSGVAGVLLAYLVRQAVLATLFPPVFIRLTLSSPRLPEADVYHAAKIVAVDATALGSAQNAGKALQEFLSGECVTPQWRRRQILLAVPDPIVQVFAVAEHAWEQDMPRDLWLAVRQNG